MPSATKSPAKVHAALLVRLEAKPGKEAAVAKFLEGGLPGRAGRRRADGTGAGAAGDSASD
jgi:hypothetical protein